MPKTNRKLRVFLCHAKEDKSTVRELYRQLTAESWIDVWLDEEKLFPGQEWRLEIPKAIRDSDVILVCLSRNSLTKDGYIQKEIRSALDPAVEKPEEDDRLPSGRRRYTLHLPLHTEVARIEVGVADHAAFSVLDPRPERPAVFYGTSIVHGIAASRPGMTYPAILGRRLDCPVINLGFSRRGQMDASLADLLGEIDATVYVIDCLPNMEASMVNDRCEAFVKRLREARPGTAIVLMEDRTYANAWVVPALAERHRASRAALMEAYASSDRFGLEARSQLRLSLCQPVERIDRLSSLTQLKV